MVVSALCLQNLDYKKENKNYNVLCILLNKWGNKWNKFLFFSAEIFIIVWGYLSRHCSLVSLDILDDVSGPTFHRMTELKILMSWLWIHGLDDEFQGFDDKYLGLDAKLHGSGDKLHGLNAKHHGWNEKHHGLDKKNFMV